MLGSLQKPPHSFTLASPLLPIPAEILQANDNLTQVINLYKQLVRGEEVNGDAAASSIPGEVTGALGTHQARGGTESPGRCSDLRAGPLRWWRPPERELRRSLCQARSCGREGSGCGTEGTGAKGSARTGEEGRPFIDKSGTCCMWLIDSPKA